MFQIINPGGWQKVFQYKGKKVISNVGKYTITYIGTLFEMCSLQ